MAVPVRAELIGGVRELGLRAGRCIARHQERARERFGHAARRLPAREALLGPQRQRLADIADRLPRALSRRLAIARGDLAHAGGALRPRLLAEQLGQGAARLERAGRALDLGAATLIEQGNARARALARVLASLDPERPLARGYAWVARRDGGVVASAAAARAAVALTLHFGDGTVDVGLDGGGRGQYAKRTDKPTQPTLF
jgi:exodeoxyribonuclease VII large subunit